MSATWSLILVFVLLRILEKETALFLGYQDLLLQVSSILLVSGVIGFLYEAFIRFEMMKHKNLWRRLTEEPHSPELVWELIRTIRRERLFILSVFFIITELLILFSIGVNIWPEIPITTLGILFFGLIGCFGAYYLFFTRPPCPLFPTPMFPRQYSGPIPKTDREIESFRLSTCYYMHRYARYLKKRTVSIITPDPSRPYIKTVFIPPIEYYYFDQEAINLFDADEQNKKNKKYEDFERNPLVEKQDALYLVLLTGIAYCSTAVNLFLGTNVLAASLPFLLCLFCVPFYHGYVRGSLRDDFGNRLKGWENLVLISVIFPIISISFWYLLPNLYFSIRMFLHQISNVPWVEVITLALVSAVGLVLVLSAIHVAVILARLVAINLTQFYFDSSPSKRHDILKEITLDPEMIEANQVLSAMLHRKETEVVLGNQVLAIRNSMVSSDKFIRGSYRKEWPLFVNTYLLCFGLVSVFIFLMHIF